MTMHGSEAWVHPQCTKKTRLTEPWAANRGLLSELFLNGLRSLISITTQMMPIRANLCKSTPWNASTSLSKALTVLPVTVYKTPAQDRADITVCSGTSRLPNCWFIPCVLVLVKEKKNNNGDWRKSSLNPPLPPHLILQPFILIPVDTCSFFDGKYKAHSLATSDESLIWEHKFKSVLH